jgi:hypothetical protein
MAPDFSSKEHFEQLRILLECPNQLSPEDIPEIKARLGTWWGLFDPKILPHDQSEMAKIIMHSELFADGRIRLFDSQDSSLPIQQVEIFIAKMAWVVCDSDLWFGQMQPFLQKVYRRKTELDLTEFVSKWQELKGTLEEARLLHQGILNKYGRMVKELEEKVRQNLAGKPLPEGLPDLGLDSEVEVTAKLEEIYKYHVPNMSGEAIIRSIVRLMSALSVSVEEAAIRQRLRRSKSPS